jgi:hypothetical protein
VVIDGKELGVIADVRAVERTALTSRPESEPPWGSEEIAKALGIPKEAKARKALRNCLQALVVSGALERVTREDDHHVYYHPLMNWESV